MRTLFTILEKLTERNIKFCFNSQGNFYNLKVVLPEGREQYIHGDSIDFIEKRLISVWKRINLETTPKIMVPQPKTKLPRPLPPPPRI